MDGTVVAHVAKLAADVLGVDASSVDGDDSFAQLGGASLEAQRLLYALRSAPTSSMDTLNYVGGWDRMTPADVIAADTPRRIAAAAMNGSPFDGTGGALTTAGMFAEAAREAKEIGVGMWDARGVWNPLEASGSDHVVKGLKPSSETVLSLGRARGVFLTGATGLLGRCLMHEILARIAPDAVLFCLVRGASAEVGSSPTRGAGLSLENVRFSSAGHRGRRDASKVRAIRRGTRAFSRVHRRRRALRRRGQRGGSLRVHGVRQRGSRS